MPDAVTVASELRTTNRLATIDYLGEDTTDSVQAATTRDTYVHLLDLLAEADLTAYGAAEVSVKLSAIGQALPADGDAIALENARAICEPRRPRARRSPSTWRTTRRPTAPLPRAARPARRLPVGRCGPAVLPAPHRGRLPRPRDGGQPGAAVQGGVQGAGIRGLPGR